MCRDICRLLCQVASTFLWPPITVSQHHNVPTMQKGNAKRALPLYPSLANAKARVVAPSLIKTTMRAQHCHLLLPMSMWAACWLLHLLPEHCSNVQEIKRSSSRQAFSFKSTLLHPPKECRYKILRWCNYLCLHRCIVYKISTANYSLEDIWERTFELSCWWHSRCRTHSIRGEKEHPHGYWQFR